MININRYCTKTDLNHKLHIVCWPDKYQQILYENLAFAIASDVANGDKYQQILYENSVTLRPFNNLSAR